MENKTKHIAPDSKVSPEIVLARLESVICELQALRRALVMQATNETPTTTPLTQKLSGILAPPPRNNTPGIADRLNPEEEYHAVSEL